MSDRFPVEVTVSGGIVASDFPRRRDTAEYSTAVSQYAERLGGQPGVVGVFQIGSVSAPGVSDLDLVVLLEDEGPVPGPALLDIVSLNAETRYLFMHRPFLLNRRAAASLHLHYRIGDVQVILGALRPEHAFPRPTVATADVTVATVVDFGVDLAAQLLHALVTRRLPVRGMLCLLFSLRHTIAGARTLGIPGTHDDYDRDVIELRRSCFTLSPAELVGETMRLVERGAAIVLEVLEGLSAHILTGDDYFGSCRMTPVVDNPMLSLAQKYYAVFADPYVAGPALAQSVNLSRDRSSGLDPTRIANRLVLLLPRMLYCQFMAYARAGGPVGANVGARLLATPPLGAVPGSRYAESLRTRVTLANVQHEFLGRHGLPFGQILLNGFSDPPRPLGWVRSAVEAVQVRRLRRARVIA